MHTWRTELKRLLVLLASTGLVGYLLGDIVFIWFLTLAAYVALNIFQLRRLYRWLTRDHRSNRSDPPESFGLWGDIFDGIYRLQKQERKASEYLENIVNKAQESSAALEMAVIMIDKKDNLDWWNRASEDLLGLKYPGDKSQSITNLIRDPRFAEYFTSENYDQPLQMNAPGDSTRILEFQIALFGEHERLMIVRDITQLHRLELMRKDFVGNVSHELGTPITVIKGYLEAILDNMEGMDVKWQKPMQQMHQQSIRMENIVKDLLLLSSLETKTIAKQQDEVSLHRLLSEIKNDTLHVFEKKQHDFIVDCRQDLQIRGDRGELYSAFSNLASNAAKYTAARGTLIFKAGFSENSFDIEFIDNGIGIEDQHLPRLTERFYRVDVSRSSETGGTGLGLAIVKHILARHDAELIVHSAVGQGSRFICKFPPSRIIEAGAKEVTESTLTENGMSKTEVL